MTNKAKGTDTDGVRFENAPYYGGFHRCFLEPPIHMEFVSESMCEMLGYTRDEMRTLFQDKLIAMVHEDDKPLFLDYVRRLAAEEQTLTLRFRMVRKDGGILYVSDTQTSKRMGDGHLYGFGVMADITEYVLQNRVPQTGPEASGSAGEYPDDSGKNAAVFRKESAGQGTEQAEQNAGNPAGPDGNGDSGDTDALLSLPYGILKCTCEKYPSVLSANKNMTDFVCGGRSENEWTAFARDNIFFMVPFEERDLFRKWIDDAIREKVPISIEHSLVRCDGSLLQVMGWLTAADGELTFLYMRVTERHRSLQRIRENSYLRALKNAYNAMFEINLTRGTVECIHENDPLLTRNTYGICMTIKSAVDFWIGRCFLPEDREMAEDYFRRILDNRELSEANRPLQMIFSIMPESGAVRKILGVSVELDAATVLFCCRDITEVKYDSPDYRETDRARSELRRNRTEAGDSGKEAEHAVSAGKPHVFIRTFGYFDVFAGNDTVRFSSDKEKELLALLVDRKGGNVTGENAVSLLWENEEISENLRAKYRKLAMGLKNTLERYGIGHILVNDRGVRHVDVAAVMCDYYEALSGNVKYKNLFSGVYMQNYSWAEETLALLIQTL